MKERIVDVLRKDPSDELIAIEGWVRTKRDSKNVCFLEVNDGSSLKGIQIVFDKNT
ncbi:MAG: asparagine--tRNA ligase, partial [Spirochaetales bacterium]|nr:asparagine--tRNA ligase [Spirochaetales bacterium]